MKTRVITVAVLLPAFLLVVLFTPDICSAILFGLMAAIGAYELMHTTGIVKNIRLTIYGMIMAFLTAMWSSFGCNPIAMQIGIFVFISVLMAEVIFSGMKIPVGAVATCFISGILMPYLFTALVRIHHQEIGRFLIIIPFVLSFSSDTGAYFIGCAFGKHKLAPQISPKKSIEGAVGGVVCAVVGMLLYAFVLQIAFDFEVNYFYALIYGVLGSAIAVFGDLCFSVIKRQVGIKDYGNLFPGHGGILDRFDSMIFVASLVEILLILLPMVG